MASNNSVTLSSGTVNHIEGAESPAADATDNSVVITGGKVMGNIRGAWSSTGDVSGNSVTISGGNVSSEPYSNISGGMSTEGISSGNSVLITGGIVGGHIVGGQGGGVSADNNLVAITGGVINSAVVFGGTNTMAGSANGNTVIISGGTGTGISLLSGGKSDSGEASGNTIIISGGTFGSGTIYGGVSTDNYKSGNFGETINNTITISGAPDLSGMKLYGGLSGDDKDMFTGNTLNVNGFRGDVAGIQNFQNYNLYLPSSLRNGDILLTVKDPTDLNKTNIQMSGMAGGGNALGAGESITLISQTSDAPDNTSVQVLKGAALLYDFALDANSGALIATARSVQTSPQFKALSEGRLAGLAFVNQGYDLLLGQGMQSALFASNQQSDGLVPFAAFQGGSSRYDTGSHVDVDGFSMLTGLAWSRDFMPHRLTMGVFFEGGWGNYNSHNSFNSAPSVKGDGDISYLGGGVLARYDLTGTRAKGLYADTSFRAGQVKNDFSSDDIRDSVGCKANYDSSAAYYGAHAGLGYVWSITDKASLDFSTRYIWTRQDSDSVTLPTDDPVHFKAADSHRWRNGARFTYAVNEYITPYAGAYYDHEFDGKARATTYGYNIDAPDLKGGTGVGELGLAIKPVKDSGFSFDLGVQGYTGVREGVTGSMQFKLEF